MTKDLQDQDQDRDSSHQDRDRDKILVLRRLATKTQVSRTPSLLNPLTPTVAI